MLTEVYRKPTHTDRYLHYLSYHPPAVKSGIIRTLLHWSRKLCQDSTSLDREIAHLTTVFQRNGYLRFMIRKVLRTTVDSSNADSTDPKATISIPFVKGFRVPTAHLLPPLQYLSLQPEVGSHLI